MFLLLPFGTDRHTRRFPYVTCTLVGLNIIVFVWMLPIDREMAVRSLGLTASQPAMRDLLTSMFMHANLLHLSFNMLYLWLFGPNVEDALGNLEFLIFYVGSGFAAALMNLGIIYTLMPMARDLPTVGASGAIAGVLGIYAIRFHWTKIRVFWYVGILVFPLKWGTFGIPAVIGLAIWLAQQVAGGLYSLVNPLQVETSYWSHIGGMLFGMLLAYALRLGLEGRKEYLLDDAASSLDHGMAYGAIGHLRALLEHDTANPKVHRELAQSYTMLHDPEHAIPHFSEAIRLLLQSGRRREALDCFTEMKRAYRNARLAVEPQYKIALYLAENRQHREALDMLSEICTLYPGTPDAETALMRMGDISLRELADPTSAILHYERFLREYPHSPNRALVERSLVEARATSLGSSGRREN